jgi:DNA-binding MarR family transcriptional regulator
MDDPPPLTDLELAIAQLLEASGQLLRRLRMESNPTDLTWSQISVLARLAKAGSATTADLARADGMKPQSMGAILASLEKEGLVCRQPHASDGRQVLFDLTEKAVEVRRQNTHLKREWLRAALEQFNRNERRTLIAAASLIARLETL